MNSPVHEPVTEQGRTIQAASAATELSVRKKPVGFSRQWFSDQAVQPFCCAVSSLEEAESGVS
jgi:hypothetical protein